MQCKRATAFDMERKKNFGPLFSSQNFVVMHAIVAHRDTEIKIECTIDI
jgi:hypothetical protein